MKEMTVILGTAHRLREPGKHSPDGRLRECIYSREIVRELKKKLEAAGVRVLTDYEPLDLPRSMQSSNWKREQQNELAMRVNYVNEVCRQRGAENVIYVSIHVNASGADGKWHEARGWCVYTSPGRTRADELATSLWNAANRLLPKTGRSAIRADWTDGDPDYEAKFYVLTKTRCAAVLTENLFQDNREDVDFLLSEAGRRMIVDLHAEGILDYFSVCHTDGRR